jgi:hypothetical protein
MISSFDEFEIKLKVVGKRYFVLNEGMTHHNVQTRKKIHHVLVCFVNLFVSLFEMFQLIFDSLITS